MWNQEQKVIENDYSFNRVFQYVTKKLKKSKYNKNYQEWSNYKKKQTKESFDYIQI